MIELTIAAVSDNAFAKKYAAVVVRARESLNRIWLDSLDAAGFPRQSAERFILLKALSFARCVPGRHLTSLHLIGGGAQSLVNACACYSQSQMRSSV
jgi:hypothetical protein